MKYYIVALWTSLGPVVLGDKNGYESEDVATDAANQLRASGVKNSNGLLTIMRLL